MGATADARMLSSILSAKCTARMVSSLHLTVHLAKLPKTGSCIAGYVRRFSTSLNLGDIRGLQALPTQNLPIYQGMHLRSIGSPRSTQGTVHLLPVNVVIASQNNKLLSLRWPKPPRNILLVKKDCWFRAAGAADSQETSRETPVIRSRRLRGLSGRQGQAASISRRPVPKG